MQTHRPVVPSTPVWLLLHCQTDSRHTTLGAWELAGQLLLTPLYRRAKYLRGPGPGAPSLALHRQGSLKPALRLSGVTQVPPPWRSTQARVPSPDPGNGPSSSLAGQSWLQKRGKYLPRWLSRPGGRLPPTFLECMFPDLTRLGGGVESRHGATARPGARA